MPAETITAILAMTLLVAGWMLWRLPVGTCPECTHCRLEQLEKDRETEVQASRIYGIPLCQACGRHHQRGEDHPH